MTYLYDLLYLLAFVLGAPWLLHRRLTRGPGSLALRERLGDVPPRPVSSTCVWIHGVSLGEINATRTLVAEIHRRSPSTAIVLSSTTRTGLDRARELYPRLTVFRFPLDFSFALRRTLERIRPSVIVLMELELWPNLMEIAHREEIPVLIANGRITEARSMRRFRWPVLRQVARRMFRRVAWIGAQDEQYAQRFIELGAPPERVAVTRSLKYDTADVVEHVDGQDELAQQMRIDPQRPLWVCGSTGPGEERAILTAFAKILPDIPGLQLAIVPRKPERFDEVADEIVAHGFACVRRSGGPPRAPENVRVARPVLLGDTIGELRKFYSLASVVFVGRTLAPLGGSDVFEIAGLGKPMLLGPHVENFAEAVAELTAERACISIANEAELAGAVTRVLREPDDAAAMASRARTLLLKNCGATDRTVDRILALLSEQE